MNYIDDFQKVVNWIKEARGVAVELGSTTSFMGHDRNLIIIHHNYNRNKNGLFALLHECGHALQPSTNVGVNAYKNIDMDEQQKKFNMGRFLNEVDAWNKGEMIASVLGIELNEQDWNKCKEESLLTYYV